MLIVMYQHEPLPPRLQDLSKEGFGLKVWRDSKTFDAVNLVLTKGQAKWHYLFTPDDWKDFLDFKAVEPKLLDLTPSYSGLFDKMQMVVPGGVINPGDTLELTGGHKPGLYKVMEMNGPNITVMPLKPKVTVNDLKTKKQWEQDVMNHPLPFQQSQAKKHLDEILKKVQQQGVLPPKMLIGIEPIAPPPKPMPVALEPMPLPKTKIFEQEYMGSFADDMGKGFEADIQVAEDQQFIKDLEKTIEEDTAFNKKFSGSKPKPPLIPKSYAELKGMGGRVEPPAVFMGELEALLKKRGVRTERVEVQIALAHLRQACAGAMDDGSDTPPGRFVDLSDDET